MDWNHIGATVRRQMASNGLQPKTLAAQSGTSDKTIYRLLNGQKIKTDNLLRIGNALGSDLVNGAPSAQSVHAEIADPSYGGYHKDLYQEYLGSFLVFRRAFSNADRIVVGFMDIAWSDVRGCLTFHEQQRNRSQSGRFYEYDLHGEIHIPAGAGILNFVVMDRGSVRLSVVSHMRKNLNNTMQGIVLTLCENTLPIYQPATSAILYQKLEAGASEVASRQVGVYDRTDEYVAQADALLFEVESNFAVMRTSPTVG